MERRGYILLAHGSRDPAWHAPIEAIAQAMRERLQGLGVHVACAYLELTAPSLPDCVKALTTQGLGTITIVPMFLGQGRHAREDLPHLVARLQADHPDIRFDLRPAIGEDPQVTQLLADLILR